MICLIRRYRARRHARRMAAFRANLPCSDETLRQMDDNVRRAWAALPSAADWERGMARLRETLMGRGGGGGERD